MRPLARLAAAAVLLLLLLVAAGAVQPYKRACAFLR
jgi:hypothetical protein